MIKFQIDKFSNLKNNPAAAKSGDFAAAFDCQPQIP